MKNKKSQWFLEFLMTYGWAILIIVCIGAMFYFGAFNLSPKIDAECCNKFCSQFDEYCAGFNQDSNNPDLTFIKCMDKESHRETSPDRNWTVEPSTMYYIHNVLSVCGQNTT